MKTALLAAVLTLFAPAQESSTKTFTEPYLGIQLNYPKTWTIQKSTQPTLGTRKVNSKKKPKVDPTRVLFEIPIPNSLNHGELEVVRTEYHASIDLWQTIQQRESELEKATLVRQWDQDILGVPMLFSRTDYGNGLTGILGLFYTRTSYKLLLRLTAPTNEIDRITYEFNKMLETMKYADGSLPKEDDPSVDLDPITKKTPPAPAAPKIIDAPATGPKNPVKGPITADFVVSTKKLTLRLPQGWTVENSPNENLTIKESTMSIPVQIQGFSVLDSDQPSVALVKRAAVDLNDYSSVTSREDVAAHVNEAGNSVSSVWRIGKASSGDLFTGYATCASGDFYIVLTYKQTNSSSYKADRKTLNELLKQISIEIAP